MIKFVDPRGVVSTPEQSYDLSRNIRLNDGEGITVALLANGFPDSELFTKKRLNLGQPLLKRQTHLFSNQLGIRKTIGKQCHGDAFAVIETHIPG